MGRNLNGSVGFGQKRFVVGMKPPRADDFAKNDFLDSENPNFFLPGLSACAPRVPVYSAAG
jgi:hypothetical protein